MAEAPRLLEVLAAELVQLAVQVLAVPEVVLKVVSEFELELELALEPEPAEYYYR